MEDFALYGYLGGEKPYHPSPHQSVETGTPCTSNEGCGGGQMCFGKVCQCPYSLEWSSALSMCVPSQCSPNFPGGWCPSETPYCSPSGCVKVGCPSLTNDTCFTCSNSTTTTIQSREPRELPSKPHMPPLGLQPISIPNSCPPVMPKGVCPNGLKCDMNGNCVGFKCSHSSPNGFCPGTSQCMGGKCIIVPGGVCGYLYHTDPNKYPSYAKCANPHSGYTCQKNPNYPPGNPYRCHCNGPAPTSSTCRNACGETYSCPVGEHCPPGLNSSCVPNASSKCTGVTCPNVMECVDGQCQCKDAGCSGTPANLLSSILYNLPGCPGFIAGSTNNASQCYVNQLQQAITVPNLTSKGVDQMGQIGSHATGSAFLAGENPGSLLAFDQGSIIDRPTTDFLTQSYMGQPHTTNLQGLFADDGNVATLTPQQCDPIPGAKTNACVGGGIPCEPGTTPIRLSPWINTTDIPTATGKPYPGKYFSVWGCQKTYGQCPPYFHPDLVYWNGNWVYGCMRNPMPTAKVCEQELNTSTFMRVPTGCKYSGDCLFPNLATDSAYSFPPCTHEHNWCHGASDYVVQDEYRELSGSNFVPQGTFYNDSIKNSVPVLKYASSGNIPYPITSYTMQCPGGDSSGDDVVHTSCTNPLWTST